MLHPSTKFHANQVSSFCAITANKLHQGNKGCTLKPMMKMLRVSRTVRHTSVEMLASNKHASESACAYAANEITERAWLTPHLITDSRISVWREAYFYESWSEGSNIVYRARVSRWRLTVVEGVCALHVAELV